MTASPSTQRRQHVVDKPDATHVRSSDQPPATNPAPHRSEVAPTRPDVASRHDPRPSTLPCLRRPHAAVVLPAPRPEGRRPPSPSHSRAPTLGTVRGHRARRMLTLRPTHRARCGVGYRPQTVGLAPEPRDMQPKRRRKRRCVNIPTSLARAAVRTPLNLARIMCSARCPGTVRGERP